MSSLKILTAAIAAASFSLAFAQGTPPKPGATDPAVGAGQRSTQNTPMGTTGTPGGGGAAAQGSAAGSGAAATAGSTGGMAAGSGATAGATASGGGTAMASDTGAEKSSGKKMAKRAKADRN